MPIASENTVNVIHLKRERAEHLDIAQRLHQLAKDERRDLSAQEQKQFDRAVAEADRIAARLDRENALLRSAQPEGARAVDGASFGAGDGTSDNGLRAWMGDVLREMRGGKFLEGVDPSDDEIRANIGAYEARDVAASTFGSALIPLDYQDKIWQFMRPKTVALATGPTIIRTNRHTISLPAQTADVTAAWTAEAGTISETDPTGATITVTPTKLAALTRLSREAVDDSNPSIAQMVLNSMTLKMALQIDLAFFEGTGASNQPTGLKSTSGITVDSTTMGTNGAAPTNLDFILKNIGVLLQANVDPEKVVIVMHSRTWSELTQLKDTTNRYLLQGLIGVSGGIQRAIDGYPVYLCNQLSTTETQGTGTTCSSVYVYDASQVVVVQREDLRLEQTKDAYFSTDQIGLRSVARIGFAVPNPTSVVRVSGVL